MKCAVISVVRGLFLVALLVVMGCGGGGSAAAPVLTGQSNSLITNVGWRFVNAAPDYTNSGPTCFMSVTLYYDGSIAPADIEHFTVTAPNGWQWTIAAAESKFGTNSSGNPYLGTNIYYGINPHMMPLAGSWVFQLRLKNGQISSVLKTLHEPGSSADAAHQYLYSEEDWNPLSNETQYVKGLGRFPVQGFTLQYDSANGGTIRSQGLAAVRNGYLASEPRAYNMVCLLYDASTTYLGYTITEFSPLDHSKSPLINGNGELSIVPASTLSPAGQVDLSAVTYLRFAFFDGAQYAPLSYSDSDHNSISSLVAVNGDSGAAGSVFLRVATSPLAMFNGGFRGE